MSVLMAGEHHFGRFRVHRGSGRGRGKTKGADAAVGFRPLRFEPMEERTLLSIDLQFHHVIYDPSSKCVCGHRLMRPVAASDHVRCPRRRR